MDVLYEDVLVNALRFLAPRSLAIARRVCTSWRDIVDDHRLLRVELLPLSLDAVLLTTGDPSAPKLFSHRSIRCTITARLDYIESSPPVSMCVSGCCNGLLLLDNHVVNPATRQSARLPAVPRPCTVPDCATCFGDYRDEYLVYDPIVSPHYEVLLIPYIPSKLPLGHIAKHTCSTGSVSAMEWPPSPYIIDVFSSKTKCWKSRSFVREGVAIGTVADLKNDVWDTNPKHSAYWHGALYVRCEQGFALRINLSNHKYQVIKLPRGKEGTPCLGKSKKGVYCTLIHGPCIAEVWFLDESREEMNWVLRNKINLEPAVIKYPRNHFPYEPWSLQPDFQAEWLLNNISNIKSDNNEAASNDGFKWDSHHRSTIKTVGWPRVHGPNAPSFKCFGYHPYEEIVLFYCRRSTVMAYHMDSSKVRRLGRLDQFHGDHIRSFAYAPCWMRGLPGS
ncbi:unnamed protein product [Alopecurus aequalis]